MFTRNDLESIDQATLTDWRFVACYPGLYYTVYFQYAFREPSAEEKIRITRAPKQLGDNGLRFWLSAEWAEGWRERKEYFPSYVRSAAFEPITEDKFNLLVAEQSSELLVQPSLPLHSKQGFVSALLLYSLDTDFVVSLFAEYEDEFIHFYWDTTA